MEDSPWSTQQVTGPNQRADDHDPIVWAIAGFGIQIFARSLNNIVIFGFPLGFYMAPRALSSSLSF
jgi:hypothetical protein